MNIWIGHFFQKNTDGIERQGEVSTVKRLKIQTPEKIAVIILKLEEFRFTTE